MATSADRDDRDEDEKDKAEASDEAPPDKKSPAKEGAVKAAAREEEDDDEEDDTAEEKPAATSAREDDEEEEDEEPAPKRPAARGPGARGPGARGARGPGAARKAPSQPTGAGSLGKSVALFFGIVIVLLVGFAYFARMPEQAAKPKWKVGETADLEVTLVKEDRQDLACASTDEVAGKHCAFEAAGKPWSKGPSTDDKLLRPYATTDNVNFAAAGLWSNPDLAVGKIPAARFAMKCKYKVDGMIKLAPRWHEADSFGQPTEWYAGTISDCKIGP